MNTIDDVLSGRAKWCVVTGDNADAFDRVRGRVSMVVTDPPYGISHPCAFKTNGRGNLAECNDYPDVHDDDKPFDPSAILSLGVPTVLWGANWFADRLPASGGWLVWDKERPDDLDQATCELAWTNCIKGVRRFRHLWNGMMRASEHGESFHPTQKPVSLNLWTLRLRWMPKDGIVFDPYCGSGPVGVAASMLGLGYIGVEINDDYATIARRRIAEAANHLFAGSNA
jgi:hypothetical protein